MQKAHKAPRISITLKLWQYNALLARAKHDEVSVASLVRRIVGNAFPKPRQSRSATTPTEPQK